MAAYTNTTMLVDTADVTGFLGKNVDAGFTVTMQDLVGVYTEAYLCNLVKYDAVTNWGSLNAVYKLIMSEYVARSIAVEAIKYDMHGFGTAENTARIHGEDMINIHLFRMQQIEKLLEAADTQDFQGI